MERNSVTNSMKDYRTGCKAIRECNNHTQNTGNKLKDSWNSNNYSNGEDYLSGFSWPPRSYTCSFCKREFRSAQALGGHMNVHRRDRARLRQSPPRDGQYPFLNLNLNLNLSPNPNPNFSTPPLVPSSFASTLTSVVSPTLSSPSYSPSSASPSQMKKWGTDGALTDPQSRQCSDITNKRSAKSFCGIKEFNGFAGKDVCKLPQMAEFVGLDLEFGVTRDSTEELDLELRLGCA